MVKENLTFRFSPWYGYVLVLLGMGQYHIHVFHRDIFPYDSLGPIGRGLHYLAYEHHSIMTLGYILAWLVHLGEAVYAYSLARRAKLRKLDQFLWFVQTFLLGFPSLMILKRIVKKEKQG